MDGAVRRSTPLTDALNALAERPRSGAEPDEVWAVVPDRPRRIAPLRLALRSPARSTGAGLLEEIKRVRAIGRRARHVKLRVLHPREELRGASLRFDPRTLRAWHQDGQRAAREASARPDAGSAEARTAERCREAKAALGRRGRSGHFPA